jgi:hypothetical protein
MKLKNIFRKFGLIAILCASVTAQKAGSPVPRQEKLLNGLKLLMWNDPAPAKVSVTGSISKNGSGHCGGAWARL